MTWTPIVGTRFSPSEFDDYVRSLVFTTWRPQFVVVHNTGVPSIADRPLGYTAAQIQNLVTYYRDQQGWSAGPHCFVDQNGIWVFTPLTSRGVHSPSWNDVAWGIETLGAYETEAFTDPIHANLVACLATLHAVAPLDVNNLRFHKEDPNTTHTSCPGKNLNKAALVLDVRTLLSARETLAAPASGRYTGRSYADAAPQSHFFADHLSLVQTADLAYGPVAGDEGTKYRVTGVVKVPAVVTGAINAFAAVSGVVMIQRVADKAVPGTFLPNVVNLVLKPFKQPMKGFTRVKYFVYRNLRLDDFLKGDSATDQALVRDKAGASPFIQNLWNIHTAQNGTAPFPSTVLGFDPANQPGPTGIDALFHRENASEQLPFAALGQKLGRFYRNLGDETFGLEIILEGDVEPDYDYVRTANEIVVEVPNASGPDNRLQRSRILHYIDPAAFYGMHGAEGGWLEVQSGATKTKLKGTAVYDDVVTKFATANTLYLDLRNENGLALDFYDAYDDTSGNVLEVGPSATSLTAQSYATHQWPLLIRKSTTAANTNVYDVTFVRLPRGYNHKPILYLHHGQTDQKTTKGRFVADVDLIEPAAATTNPIGFRHPNKDLGSGQRIGTAWLIRADYTLRQDLANIPFPATVAPTASHRDNVFGPIDAKVPWRMTDPVLAWATGQDNKYVDGDGIAALGFEHTADRGIAFSQWSSSSAGGTVLFYATAKDSFVNAEKDVVPQHGISSGVSNRDSYFDEPMLFDGYAVDYGSITDGVNQIQSFRLRETQPHSRPPDAMMVVGLSRTEVDGQLKPLAGLDARHPRNIVLEEVAGSPFPTFRKYKVGLRGIQPSGVALDVFPATNIFAYTEDSKFFWSAPFAQATPAPPPQLRDAEEQRGAQIRPGDSYVIVSASGVNVTVKPNAVSSPPNAPKEPEVDFTREIIPGDTVTIRNAGFGVAAVVMSGKNGVITLDHSPGALTANSDILYCPNKAREDYFIDKDRLVTNPPSLTLQLLVREFMTKVNAVADDAAAPAALQALAEEYGPKILDRARLLCSGNNFAYADDRILYWARIKMTVQLKNHPYLAKNATARAPVLKAFEVRSRGYQSLSFGGAGTLKKVLLTGFDPFGIGDNAGQSNPSGAAALALHGGKFPKLAPKYYVQSAIFPVRYADFGDDVRNPDKHVAEDFFTPFLQTPADKPHLIMTLSQAITFELLLERFACRMRLAGAPDNLDTTNVPFPPNVPGDMAGDEFYETTLDATKIIPAGNQSGKFKIFYNNHFVYVWSGNASYYLFDVTTSKVTKQPDSGSVPVENAGHPEHHKLVGLVPSDLTGTTTPKMSEITSFRGSGGSYLSNEIFYRSARLRALHNPNMKTGHYHLPKLQHHANGMYKTVSALDPKVGSTVGLQFDLLKELIEEIINSLTRAFS